MRDHAAAAQHLRSEGKPEGGLLLAGANSNTAGQLNGLASGEWGWAKQPLSPGQQYQERGLRPGREIDTRSADPDCIRSHTPLSSSCVQAPEDPIAGAIAL